MLEILSDYYRLPPSSLQTKFLPDERPSKHGFFQFGSEIVCYGSSTSGAVQRYAGAEMPDALEAVRLTASKICLPFDPSRVIDNLRREHYSKKSTLGRKSILNRAPVRAAYYFLRPLLGVSVRRYLQRIYLSDWRKLGFPNWPVDVSVDALHEEILRLSMVASGVQKIPFIWFWPEGAPACLIMTHDVETAAGRDFSSVLMDLDASFNFRASFQVVPEQRYEIPDSYVQEIRSREFEFNLQDLNHDGHLFDDYEKFLRRAKKINQYVHHYQAHGFRAGSMYRNSEWYDAFEFSYDMSVPNIAHLEPQRGGCCTIMPFFIGRILELPLTTTQDYTLLQILNQHTIDLWKKQLDLIGNKHGLISFLAHPDYLTDRRSRQVYTSLLDYLQQKIAREKIWSALPREVDRWWRARSQMKLVQQGGDWAVAGPENQRARVAYAVLDGSHRLAYELAPMSSLNVVRS
jgi:hypothetical protein